MNLAWPASMSLIHAHNTVLNNLCLFRFVVCVILRSEFLRQFRKRFDHTCKGESLYNSQS